MGYFESVKRVVFLGGRGRGCGLHSFVFFAVPF